MFSLGIFSKPEKETVAIFDIGSSSVCSGLVEFQKGSTAKIIFTDRQFIEFRSEVDPQSFFKDMLSALRKSNEALVKKGVPVKHVVYAFSSPWAASQTRFVTIEKPEPFVLTKAMVDKVIEKEELLFESNALGGIKEGISDKLSTIEKRIVNISLNGYDIDDPYGKKTKSADISFFTTIIPKMVLDKVFDMATQTYHPKDTKAYSFSLTAFGIIRDLFHEVNDFIFLNISGEVCDVSVIKKGMITESASFPLGYFFLVRQVSKELKVSPLQAESMIKLYLNEHADETNLEKLDPLMKSLSKEWVSTLHNLVFQLSDTVSLPQDLFITSDTDLVKFFNDAIAEEPVTRLGVDSVPFTVHNINSDSFKGIVDFAPGVAKDHSISVITAFLHNKI